MSCCERCWLDARKMSRETGESVEECYKHFLMIRQATPCTPKEQAGQYWDNVVELDRRHVLYPYIKEISEALEEWCPPKFQNMKQASPDYHCYITKEACNINWCVCCVSNKYRSNVEV